MISSALAVGGIDRISYGSMDVGGESGERGDDGAIFDKACFVVKLGNRWSEDEVKAEDETEVSVRLGSITWRRVTSDLVEERKVTVTVCTVEYSTVVVE